MQQGFSWGRTITALLEGESLSESTAAAAMMEIMEGAATPAQIAGFVVALRAKGETTDEIVGFVGTMRSYGEKVHAGGEVLDTCGTGGDRAGTFNVSTAAALVCAGAGVKVAKHGNRAASSRCGSADVLEALASLGSNHVVAFHGDRGLDELATSGPSRIVELRKGEVREWKIDPAELGLAHAPVEAVAGGNPPENASAIRSVLEGDAGPRRDIVFLNP